MRSHYYLAFAFTCSLSFLSAELSKECKDSQYPWPRTNPEFCCDRCPPGNHMLKKRSDTDCTIDCAPCETGKYRDKFNLEFHCIPCRTCREPNMELELPCTSTHNAVCRCKVGYRCTDHTCKECEQISTPNNNNNALSPPPTTTVSNTLPQPSSTTKLQPPTKDTMWPLVAVVLLVVVVSLFLAAKIRPFQRWTRYKLGNILDKEPAPVSTSAEDEGVSKPIQEVCGKCDQLLDV